MISLLARLVGFSLILTAVTSRNDSLLYIPIVIYIVLFGMSARNAIDTSKSAITRLAPVVDFCLVVTLIGSILR